MIGIVYNLEDEALCDIQLQEINNSLLSMPSGIKPLFASESYSYKKYHPTLDKICLPLELGRFPEWDIYINSAITGNTENIGEDWNETPNL